TSSTVWSRSAGCGRIRHASTRPSGWPVRPWRSAASVFRVPTRRLPAPQRRSAASSNSAAATNGLFPSLKRRSACRCVPASTPPMLGRSHVLETKYDEAGDLLRQALAIQERVFGLSHPRVASALNDLGNAALKQNLPDEAEACYRRIASIYRAAYGDKHYLV